LRTAESCHSASFNQPWQATAGTARATARCSEVTDFMTRGLSLLKAAAASWVDHKDARLGAALAYYSVFSLGPLMVIAVAVAGLVFGEDAARGGVELQLRGLLGEAAAKAIDAMLAGARKPQQGAIATAVGIAFLLFAAVGVVVQLKDAFNTVWEVDPKKISGAWQFARAYLVSLAAVLALGFLLMVSLLFTAALSAIGKYVSADLPEVSLQIGGSLTSFAAIAIMFAMMFKWLPDAPVAWRDVWSGAVITAALFEVGKLLIGLYIGSEALDSSYGAAASLVVVLIWVYYSSQIVLLGAEFTHIYAMRRRLTAPPL
jgi:membrane protein